MAQDTSARSAGAWRYPDIPARQAVGAAMPILPQPGPPQPRTANGALTISALLARHRGVFIGEPHAAVDGFLVRNLRRFRQAGARRLFVEAVNADDQAVLDAFNARAPGADARLVALLSERWGRPFYYDVMCAARDAGMSITGIDTPRRRPGATYDQFYTYEHVNQRWREAIERSLSPGERYLVLGGTLHGQMENGHGIDQLLGIPALLVSRDPAETPVALNDDMVVVGRSGRVHWYAIAEPAVARAALIVEALDGAPQRPLAKTLEQALAFWAAHPADGAARRRARSAYEALAASGISDQQGREALLSLGPLLYSY